MEQVYKVQVDAFGLKILVYNKDRSHFYEGMKPSYLNMKPLTGRYAMGSLDVNGQIAISGFLPEDHTEDW